MRGFAAGNVDLGTSPNADAAAGFIEKQNDFGNRGTHVMTVAAKSIIEQFYGRPASYSYFSGGSTGGQQALVEAQRYPEDYNGIIAGCPGSNRTARSKMPGRSILHSDSNAIYCASLDTRVWDCGLDEAGLGQRFNPIMAVWSTNNR